METSNINTRLLNLYVKKIYFNYIMIVHVFAHGYMHIRSPQGPGMSDSLELVMGAGT